LTLGRKKHLRDTKNNKIEKVRSSGNSFRRTLT